MSLDAIELELRIIEGVAHDGQINELPCVEPRGRVSSRLAAQFPDHSALVFQPRRAEVVEMLIERYFTPCPRIKVAVVTGSGGSDGRERQRLVEETLRELRELVVLGPELHLTPHKGE